MIYLELFWTFFKIGAFTFGGGYAMLPLIQSEVAAKGWLDSQSLVNFAAVSESTPGPFAVNMATYVGTETGGVLGAVCATLGVALPSFVIILLVAKFFAQFGKNRVVRGCMAGLKPAVVGMIASAVISVAAAAFFPAGVTLSGPEPYAAVVIFIPAVILAFKKVHPIAIIALCALLGILAGCFFL